MVLVPFKQNRIRPPSTPVHTSTGAQSSNAPLGTEEGPVGLMVGETVTLGHLPQKLFPTLR